MSTCGFRGRGFVRRSPRPNGPAGGFAGPRFPHPNFNQTRPPPKRLPAPEKWGERPGGFPPWQGNTNFQQRPQFRGNIPFRPNGRGRMPNGRGMVRFSGPGRPPSLQYPMAPMRLPMMPRVPFVNTANTQEKTIMSPLPGSQEERQQKICETADKLKQKLSSITQEEIMHFWEDDFTGEQTNYTSEEEQQKGSKVIAELRHGPPELDLTFTDLRDIGRVDSNKLEGEGCPEEIDLIDDIDSNVNRFESTNDEISITYSKNNDVVVISSTDTECINPGATIEENKSHKEATSEISDVTAPYLVGNNEKAPCTSANASETVGSFSHLLSETKTDMVASTQAVCKNVPETVHGQQLKQTKAFEEVQKDSSIRKKAAKSPSVLQTIPLPKQNCVPFTDVLSENAWSDALPSPLSNNEGLSYPDVQIPSGSGFCSKTHNELPSFAPRLLNSKYHWSSKGINRFPIAPPNKPEHSHQMPVLRPRMTTQQLNPISYSPRPLSSPLITNSVCATDFPLNFDPAKPPPHIRPTLRPNKGNLETPVSFNIRGPIPLIPAVGTTMTDSLPGFNHQDPLPKLYNHDDSLRSQQMYSPCGFLPEQSNLIAINPTESVPMNLMDMTPVAEFSLDSTATNFVQLPSVPPSPRPSFMSNLQIMNFPPVISNRGAEQISHDLQLSACSPIEVPKIEAPPPLPEGLLSDSEMMDDPPEATINDGLEDMQEAMKFANQIMNMSEQMENSVDSEIPLPNTEPPLPKASPLNNEGLDQSSLRIIEALVEGENTSGEPKTNHPQIDDVTAEETLEPQNVEKANQNEDANAQNTLPIDELMRPKVIFNLNSKARRISIVEDWQHQNDEAKQRKAKATNQTSECKKVSQLPSLHTSTADNTKEGDPKKKTLNKTCNPNSQDTEVKKATGPKILDDILMCRLSDKSRLSLMNVKTANNVASQKPEKSKRGQKPVARTAELSWKNRVISRFLKMSKNDICNMVNNSSLRKFDIAMKHLVKEKKSSLSLELRNTEDDKIKGYDQEEFMSQLNAMLDPSATVDITNLPTEFIHHLSEVLQLDPMPFESNNSIQSNTEAKEPAAGNILVDESSLNSTDAQVESKNPKVVLDVSKDETQTSSLQHTPSVSEVLKWGAQQSPLITEGIVNETSLKTQRALFNAADLDNILSVVGDKPTDCVNDIEELNVDPLKGNTALQSQPSVNDVSVEFPQTEVYKETIPVKEIVTPIINTASVRPRKSTSEDRSTLKLETYQRWSRKEREDLDAFRNLTKEEWEAKYGKQLGSGSSGSRRCFSNTRVDSFRINQYHLPKRQCLSETAARNPSPSLSPVACESTINLLNRVPNRHNGFAEPLRAKRSRSPSTSSSSTSSESEREPVNSDVTKLLKVIKEKENIAKTKSINETIRDEVTAEIERKRKEKTKYKEKKCSSKYSKRRTERKGKHRKRTKDKKKKKGSKSSSTESEEESSEEDCLLAEDEIKKEVVVKEEVLTSPEKNLPPNGVTVNSGTAARETHNIMVPIHVPQITEPAAELQPTAVLSADLKVRNVSPCAMFTLQPKTKAQLKQMPEATIVDRQCNADQPCQAAMSIKNVTTINCEANKNIGNKIEEVHAEAERLKQNDQSTVIELAGQNNMVLSDGVTLPVNLNSVKSMSPERSSPKIKSIETNRTDKIPNSNLALRNPKMSKLVPSAAKREKSVKVPNRGKQQKPADSSLHTVTQNMTKAVKSKPKKIDIKVYKERELQRRLREEGKLEESGDSHGLIAATSSTPICKTSAHTTTDDSLAVKKNIEACLPSTSKNDSNITELSVTSNVNDSLVPGTLASSTSLVRKNGSRRCTENVAADNTSNSMKNSLETEYKSTEEPKTIPMSVGTEVPKQVEFKKNPRKKPKIISVSVVKESTKKFKKIQGKRQRPRRRNGKQSPNKSQDANFNLLSNEIEGRISINDVSEKIVGQEIESQVDNNFDHPMPIEENQVNEIESNKNRITNMEEARDESVVNNLKTESPDHFDSTTESTLHVLTPIKINEAHAKYSEDENRNRPIDVVTHTNDRLEVSKELHCNTLANQGLPSCIEEEPILPTSPKTQCVIETAPELISADGCTSFEQQFSESNEPSEIQTKESSHNQLLTLQPNLIKEEITLQSKIHETIIEHNTIESNGAQSGDTNDINADLKNVKEILVSHISNTKESINKYDGICNAISAESSSSPFAGFGQEWNQDCMYNEKISSLHYGEVDAQFPSPSCAGPDPNITENLHSEDPAILPRVTSEVIIKTSSIIDGSNDRSIFNEETRDTPSRNTKELTDKSNDKISLEQPCVRREYDLTLKSEIPMDPLSQNSNSYHVVSEFIYMADDNIEQYPKVSTFRENIKENSCDGNELPKLHPENFVQACSGSPEDHDYSTNHQHVENNTTNEDKQHYPKPTTNFRDKSENPVYTGNESQKTVKLNTSLKEEHTEFNNSANPTESEDLRTGILSEANTAERVTTPLGITSSEHDNSGLSNANQEGRHELFKALALDSSSCSMEVPKKINVPTKAALKAPREIICAPSATTPLKDPKVTESNTSEVFQNNSLFTEVRDLSRANRAKEIIPEADIVHANNVDTNDDHSSGTDRSVSILSKNKNTTINSQFTKNSCDIAIELQKVEGAKQTHDRTHKTMGKNAKQSKGEQIDHLHKIKSKPDLKRKHSKKQNISEKTVSDAVQSGLVQIGEPNTKESVIARMIEIDLQINKLMTEKMKLYNLLENNAVPSEATLQSVAPMPVSDEQCTPGPSGLVPHLVQKVDVSVEIHQPVHKTKEPTAQHNLHSTSASTKRKASTRKEHSHRKRIALSYTSDEDDTTVSKKTANSKDGVESVESSSRPRSATPERITEKKRHSDKPSHGDGGKSSRHKVSSDIKEEHSDRKLAKVHKPSSSDDARRKTVSPNAEKKHTKKGHRDKPITVKSVSNAETDGVKRKSEMESDNNPSLISSKNDSIKRTIDTCIPTRTRRESSSEKPQPIRITDGNVPKPTQTVKSCEDLSGNEWRCDAKKQLLNDTSIENKQTSSTRPVSEARTSEGLSIYSDESTWESFPKNPDESNDQKKLNTGLALLEMSYKKELAKSRKLKTRKRKRKHLKSAQTVNTLTSDEEELSLSILYEKKLQQKRNLSDSMDSKVDDPSNLDNQNNSQNLDKIINAVAEDRVQELYIEQRSELREKSNNQETKLHTEISKPNCDTREIQNDSRLKLQTLAGETERLKDDTHILIGKDNFEAKIAEKVTEESSLHVKQSIDLPTLHKSVDLCDNQIKEGTHADKDYSTIETQQNIEMPRLYPLNESSIDKNEFVTKTEDFPIGNFKQDCTFTSADVLPQNTSNAQDSVCGTQSVASYPEKAKVNKEPESTPEEFISCEENKFGRKKKSEPVLEESFKPQRSRRDSAQSTDTMTTDSNSGTNQDSRSRKYMKRKRKNNEHSVRKRSRLTEENIKRSRLDIDASADSCPDTDTEGKTLAAPIEVKPLEKTSKETVSVASASRKRSTSTSKQQNNRKYTTHAVDDDIQTVKQISSHKKHCEPRLYTQQLKDCEVRLVDSKYTLLKPNIDPNVLRRYGISKINPYLEDSQNTGENQILSLQSSHAEPVPDACTKQNTSLAGGNLSQDTSDIQIVKNIAKEKDLSRIKPQNFENEISLIRDRRPSSGDEISVIPTRSLETAIISLDSEVPDIEIVQETNLAKTHSEDSPEATLSVIEPNDDEDRGRTKYTVHKGPILDIKVFGNTFLAASEDGTIYRYSQATNGILNIYKGHKAAVTCLYVYTVGLSDSTKAWMFSGSLDGTLRCYNITTGVHIRDAVDVGSPVQCLDEAWGIIFVGTKSGQVSRYHIKSGTVKGESIQFSDKSVLALKATNEGSRRVLIVASRNQPITIRDAQTGLFLRTISGQKSHTVYSLMRHNNLIYCGTSSTSIPVFDFTDGEEIVQYHAGVGIVCMRLYSDLLFAGCYDGNIYIFNTKDHRLICSTPGPGNMLLSMEIVDNKIIAGSKDRRLQSWQMPKQVRSLLLRVT